MKDYSNMVLAFGNSQGVAYYLDKLALYYKKCGLQKHADEISHIITYYFMAQRVKLPKKDNPKAYKDYIKKLTLLHEMLVTTMKAKQTTDTANVAKLRTLLKQFHEAYSGKAASHEHPH